MPRESGFGKRLCRTLIEADSRSGFFFKLLLPANFPVDSR
jgi:hypothetical protein